MLAPAARVGEGGRRARGGITHFGNVLFLVNVKSNDEEWPAVQDSLVKRFRPFAHYFHGRIKPLIESRKLAEINFPSSLD